MNWLEVYSPRFHLCYHQTVIPNQSGGGPNPNPSNETTTTITITTNTTETNPTTTNTTETTPTTTETTETTPTTTETAPTTTDTTETTPTTIETTTLETSGGRKKRSGNQSNLSGGTTTTTETTSDTTTTIDPTTTATTQTTPTITHICHKWQQMTNPIHNVIVGGYRPVPLLNPDQNNNILFQNFAGLVASTNDSNTTLLEDKATGWFHIGLINISAEFKGPFNDDNGQMMKVTDTNMILSAERTLGGMEYIHVIQQDGPSSGVKLDLR